MICRKVITTTLFLSALLAACNGQPSVSPPGGLVEVEGGSYTNVAPVQLAEMLKSKDFFFVNAHIPYEGEIEPTDAFIPYDLTEQRLSEYPADKSAKVVLYCRSGSMSVITAKALVKAGYTNVWNLDGGMNAWEQAGLLLKGQ